MNMPSSFVGITPIRLYTASFGKNIKKVVSLRNRYRDESPMINGYGELEGLLFREKGINYVIGYKNLKRPLGIPAFDCSYFRKESPFLWQLKAQSPLNKGLILVNTEPGIWVIAPEDNMQLNLYTKLLEGDPWTKVRSAQNIEDEQFYYGEGSTLDKAGLSQIDILIVRAIENYISYLLLKIQEIKYDTEGCCIENDINHLRIYLKNYKEKTEISNTNEVFVTSGVIKRAESNKVKVIRPTSELCRLAVVQEIKSLERKYSKAMFNKKSQVSWFRNSADLLSQYYREVWPDIKLPSPT